MWAEKGTAAAQGARRRVVHMGGAAVWITQHVRTGPEWSIQRDALAEDLHQEVMYMHPYMSLAQLLGQEPRISSINTRTVLRRAAPCTRYSVPLFRNIFIWRCRARIYEDEYEPCLRKLCNVQFSR